MRGVFWREVVMRLNAAMITSHMKINHVTLANKSRHPNELLRLAIERVTTYMKTSHGTEVMMHLDVGACVNGCVCV